MGFHSSNELPLGARVLPGVDLRLWLLLIVTACVGALVGTALAWAVH